MTYDLHIEGVPPDEVRGSRCFTFGNYRSPLGVQGIQKLVDRYLKCLCTPKGTDLGDLNYGTALMQLLAGNVDNRSVRQIATTAIRDAEEQIRALDVNSGYPETERLSGVAIESLDVSQDNLTLVATLLLTNIAGTVVRLLVPVIDSMATPPTTK